MEGSAVVTVWASSDFPNRKQVPYGRVTIFVVVLNGLNCFRIIWDFRSSRNFSIAFFSVSIITFRSDIHVSFQHQVFLGNIIH